MSQKESGVPLINLSEFLLNTDPNKKNVQITLFIFQEAMFWFKYSLKFYEKVDPNNIDRCLITLAVLCNSAGQVSSNMIYMTKKV